MLMSGAGSATIYVDTRSAAPSGSRVSSEDRRCVVRGDRSWSWGGSGRHGHIGLVCVGNWTGNLTFVGGDDGDNNSGQQEREVNHVQ